MLFWDKFILELLMLMPHVENILVVVPQDEISCLSFMTMRLVVLELIAITPFTGEDAWGLFSAYTGVSYCAL